MILSTPKRNAGNRRLVRLLAALLGIVRVALHAQYAEYYPPLPPNTVVLSFNPKECGCMEVKIPQPWRFESPRPNAGSLVFRMTSGRIFVGSEYDIGDESLNRYALSFQRISDPVYTTPVAPEIWKAAPLVTLHRKSLFRDYRDGDRIEKVTFRGREYPRTGKYWANTFAAALPSPSGRLLALQSFTGGRKQDANRVKEGSIFIDVYDTSTGEPRCRVEGTHSDYLGATLLDNTFWLSDDHLVASIAPNDMRRFLFCSFRSSKIAEDALRDLLRGPKK